MIAMTHIFQTPPCVTSFAAVGGSSEGEGNLGNYFDFISDDEYFGKTTYEQAESELQRQTAALALQKAGLNTSDIDLILGGDLLNQCVATSFAHRESQVSIMGLYSACSTFTESLILSAALTSAGLAKRVLGITSSHFYSAERQYRMPIEYGGQRAPTTQRTATASGAFITEQGEKAPYIKGFTVGRIVDMGVTDAANMGAAMAPAAYDTITRFFSDTGLHLNDYDKIVTGDLGEIGSQLLYKLFERDGVDISAKHLDCGKLLYDPQRQDVHSGGSGCGCVASVSCAYLLPKLQSGETQNILLAATGALMSPTMTQQGESIPAISHAVWLSHSS
ncbi:MAG: stage V sporulation protein AD [Ruminococcus sp.]|nr:stage V sporulation protein AD [Ruminococcus sp.]